MNIFCVFWPANGCLACMLFPGWNHFFKAFKQLNAEKNDFDQRTWCEAPVCWSKYTRNIYVIKLFNIGYILAIWQLSIFANVLICLQLPSLTYTICRGALKFAKQISPLLNLALECPFTITMFMSLGNLKLRSIAN